VTEKSPLPLLVKLSLLRSLSLGSGFALKRARRHSKPLKVKIGLVVLGWSSGRSLFPLERHGSLRKKGEVTVYVLENFIVL
jgi:hypothetical protein